MNGSDQVVFTIVVSTILFLLIIGLVVALMIINSNCRRKHVVELAEFQLQRDQEVMSAEREATEQTLTEVGRELHDNIGQLLTATQMGFRNNLDEDIQEEGAIGRSMETLEQTIEEVRRLARSLNSDLWRDRTLVDAIAFECERLSRMRVVAMRFEHGGDVFEIDNDSKTILFRCFQEVISNAIRHGQARNIDVALSVKGGPVLKISDDGRGFDAEKTTKGAGLNNIRRRSRLIGFTAEVDSEVGNGCAWTFAPANNVAFE